MSGPYLNGVPANDDVIKPGDDSNHVLAHVAGLHLAGKLERKVLQVYKQSCMDATSISI